MKVIFLDNDGVICLASNWGSRFKKQSKMYIGSKPLQSQMPVDLRFDNFDKKAIEVLNKVLEETGAEIVVSSDWKKHATLEELGEFYEMQGICKKPVDVTLDLMEFDPEAAALFGWKGWQERARCLEIQEWLKRNEVEKWVAVDDLDMSNDYLRPGLEHFVHCPRSGEGIKQVGIRDKVVSFLK